MKLVLIIVFVLAGVAQGQDFVLVWQEGRTRTVYPVTQDADGNLSGGPVLAEKFPNGGYLIYVDGEQVGQWASRRANESASIGTAVKAPDRDAWFDIMPVSEFNAREATSQMNWILWLSLAGVGLVLALKWGMGKRHPVAP